MATASNLVNLEMCVQSAVAPTGEETALNTGRDKSKQ